MDIRRNTFIDIIELIPYTIVVVLQMFVVILAMGFLGIGFLLTLCVDWLQRTFK